MLKWQNWIATTKTTGQHQHKQTTMPKGWGKGFRRGCGAGLVVGAALGAGAVAAATHPRRAHCKGSTRVVLVTPAALGPMEEWMVTHQGGVQWRSAPQFDQRIPGEGPAQGERFWGHIVANGNGMRFLWVDARGYLPLNTPNGNCVLAKVIVQQAPAQPPQQQPTQPPSYTTSTSVESAPPPPPPPPVKPAWKEYTDPATGRKYWHCPETGVTTWDAPAN